MQEGVTFRDAYKMVGMQVQKGTFTPDKNVNHTHIGSIGNLCLEDIVAKMKTAL